MIRLLASLAVVGLLATACGEQPNGADDAGVATPGSVAPDAGEGLTVVATVFPLAWLADQIAPGAEVAFLGARGQDPHDLELSPRDRELVETAAVLLYMGGLDFQPQVESAVPSARGRVVDVAAIAGPDRLLDVDHEDHEGDDAAVDPHLWFDAALMAAVAEETGAAFADADAERAADYRANARAVADRLRELDADIDSLLTDCRRDTAIVSHEAYDYLLQPRDLHQEGISGPGGHGEASPQRLAALIERIREEDIDAIAAEPFEGRADAEVLAREAGVDLVEIDSLEVVTDEQFEVGYPALLQAQAEAFATVLECG